MGSRIVDAVEVRDQLGGTTKAELYGAYGKSLTVLVSSKIAQSDDPDADEESDEDVIERWTPRCRQ